MSPHPNFQREQLFSALDDFARMMLISLYIALSLRAGLAG